MPGERFKITKAADVWGPPVVSSTYTRGTVSVPLPTLGRYVIDPLPVGNKFYRLHKP